MAYGDLTYFGASRAANGLFSEIGAPIQKCVFDICGHTLISSLQPTQKSLQNYSKCIKDGLE